MSNGRTVGAVIGVGVLAGVGAFLLSRKSKSDTSREGFGGGGSRGGGTGTSWGDSPSLPQPSSSRFPMLVERWRNEVTQRSNGLPIDALLEWIRIESGGDMCAIGGPTEVGIFQLFFPSDAKYGATLEGLRAICQKSKGRANPSDISWLSEAELDMEVGAGIRKVLAARERVRQVFGQSGVRWPESSFDFGSAVKQIHATPAVITELVPKITRQSGPPSSWKDLYQKVMSFPVAQMGPGLTRLWNAPSKRGLRNRLEDTLRNAEFVGRAWGYSAGSYAVSGRWG